MAIRKHVTSKDTGISSKEGTKNIELGNDCKVYVAPEGDVYNAGKVYSNIPISKANKLLSYKDDKGIRYFYEVTEESLAKRKRAKDLAMQRLAEDMARKMIESGEYKEETIGEEDGEEEEIDTGAMALKDADGNEVGKVEV